MFYVDMARTRLMFYQKRYFFVAGCCAWLAGYHEYGTYVAIFHTYLVEIPMYWSQLLMYTAVERGGYGGRYTPFFPLYLSPYLPIFAVKPGFIWPVTRGSYWSVSA
jgi:hypothetical protein